MVRALGILAGLGFVTVLLFTFLVGLVSYIKEPPAKSVEDVWHKHPEPVGFASDGPFGRFDNRQLQRGFQVYKEVCSACHSLHLVHFRDLEQIGFTKPEVKALAKGWVIEVPSVDPKTGEPATRKATPADTFPDVYANETAGRAANNNALPPDLSDITLSRHGGPDYVKHLIIGYEDQPAALLKQFPDAKTPDSLHYNPYFANLNIAMPPPLAADGQVTYTDGTVSTRDQMAKDIAAFLVWTAEPSLERRHRAGWAVVIYLLIGTGLAWFAYRSVWAGVKH